MRRTSTARAVLAGFVVAAGSFLGVIGSAGPATAAGCSGSGGVTVVVDFNELGGGVRDACYSGSSGQVAATMFTATGFELTQAQRERGFVCRVQGVPKNDPCVVASPSNAYWSLWWSDGKSGKWTYANFGAYSLKVPEGGYVAWSWSTGGRPEPETAATPRAAAAQPSPTPSPPPSGPPTTGGNSGGSTKPGGKSRPGGGSGSGGSGGSTTSPDSESGSAGAGITSGGATTDSDQPDRTDDPEAGEKATPDGKAGPGQKKSGKKSRSGKSAQTSPSADPTAGSSDPSSSASADADEDFEAPGSNEAAVTEAGGLPGWVAPGLIALLFAIAAGAGLRRRRARGV